ncbi:MAG: hypothetical protein ACP5TH_07730 [Fervidicoccaceae archaeon]
MIEGFALFVSTALIASGIASILTCRSLFRFIIGMFSASLGTVYLLAMSCLPLYTVALIASITGMSEAVLISFLILLSKRRVVEDFDELREA